jgi:TetR/AcrR family transcriptional regulator of autoinduction and epiphytic fitness
MPTRATEAVDGRLSRTVRSRQAICEACLDLVQEGVLQPSADQIAEHAQVSRRSIFNHFSDLAELYDAVVDAGMQRCAPLLKEIPPSEPVQVRVEMLIAVRSKFLEATAPFTRALTAQSLVGPAGPQARRVAQAALRMQRLDMERLFRSELEALSRQDRLETAEAISAATSPHAWEYLRRGTGLSVPRASAVMRRTLTSLLREAGVELP